MCQDTHTVAGGLGSYINLLSRDNTINLYCHQYGQFSANASFHKDYYGHNYGHYYVSSSLTQNINGNPSAK